MTERDWQAKRRIQRFHKATARLEEMRGDYELMCHDDLAWLVDLASELVDRCIALEDQVACLQRASQEGIDTVS